MKTTKLIAATLTIAGGIMTGCTKTGENYTNQSTPAYICVTEPGKAPKISNGTFQMSFNFDDGAAEILSPTITFADGNTAFHLRNLPFQGYTVNGYGAFGNIYIAESTNPGNADNGTPVTDLKFEFGPKYCPPADMLDLKYNDDPTLNFTRPTLSFIGIVGGSGLSLECNIGNKQVVTFLPDVTYCGLTKTNVEGMADSEFESDGIRYRVRMNLQTMKADLIMYNVQFNPKMPQMTNLILAGLDLTFDPDGEGYSVEGSNITPLYINGGTLLQQPMFPFTTFKLQTNRSMTKANINFTINTQVNTPAGPIAATYKGSFSGSNMITFRQN